MESGLAPLEFEHEFSAEIDVVKQGFIERNFRPRILFRDVRDFLHEDAVTATTAYGTEATIPTNLHVLVAGISCLDLSSINNRRKTLEDDGESGDTWRAVYAYSKAHRPRIVLLENVKSKKETWDAVVVKWEAIDFGATWLYCDTKDYYLPQTRQRMCKSLQQHCALGRC